MKSRDQQRSITFTLESPGAAPEVVAFDGATKTAEVAPGRKPVAIIIAHGMGQQVPYETQNAIAQGLLDVGATGRNATARVKNVASGCERLQRLEFEL